jgi:hypothetical protein
MEAANEIRSLVEVESSKKEKPDSNVAARPAIGIMTASGNNPVSTIFLVPFRLFHLPFSVLGKLLSTVRRNNPRLLRQTAHSRFFPVSGLDEVRMVSGGIQWLRW